MKKRNSKTDFNQYVRVDPKTMILVPSGRDPADVLNEFLLKQQQNHSELRLPESIDIGERAGELPPGIHAECQL